jgi:rhodanese-related sulfurtransferase
MFNFLLMENAMNRTITREELHRKLSSAMRPTLVEALPEKYYADKHLPGALNLPHDRVDTLAPKLLPDRNAEIVVYCANRQCQNSHIAAHRLSVLGYTDVAVYPGGKQDWDEAGLPFESTTEPAVTA